MHYEASEVLVGDGRLHVRLHGCDVRSSVRKLWDTAVAPVVGAGVMAGAADARHLTEPCCQEGNLTLNDGGRELRLRVRRLGTDVEKPFGCRFGRLGRLQQRAGR